MRTILLIIFCFSPPLHAEDMRFKSSEYAFIPNHPVFVLEVKKSETEKLRVCYTGVRRLSDGKVRFGTAVPEDISECSSVESFGRSESSEVIRGVLEGRTVLSPPRRTREEQVRIKGKFWTMSSDVKVIVRALNKSPKDRNDYAGICRLELSPLDRVDEENAPLKTIFCKTLKPIDVHLDDGHGKLRFDDKGQPLMTETWVCPLPENCVKPDWEITPTDRFIPGVDKTTAHAEVKNQAIVHIEPKPATP